MTAALIPARLADRLRPLIGKLGSDHDGEVLSACRALRRQLERHELNFSDLANGLIANNGSQRRCNGPQEPESQTFTHYAEAVSWLLREHSARLAPHQKKFLRDMRNILRRWPPKPKQARWIENLIYMHGGIWHG